MRLLLGSLSQRLLPVLAGALEPQRPAPALPREPLRFVGRYSTNVSAAGWEEVKFEIVEAAHPQSGTALRFKGWALDGKWLDFKYENAAPGSCWIQMASALEHEWVTFRGPDDAVVAE